MLIDPQHEGAPGLDSETWEGNNASGWYPSPGNLSNHNEGAPGPSHLGTGEGSRFPWAIGSVPIYLSDVFGAA